MLEAQWLDVLKPLGAAVPLVAVLIYLLRQAQQAADKQAEERKTITSDFLETLRQTVATNATTMAGVTTALSGVITAVSELTNVMRERHTAGATEHAAMVDLLHKMAARLEAR